MQESFPELLLSLLKAVGKYCYNYYILVAFHFQDLLVLLYNFPILDLDSHQKKLHTIVWPYRMNF